MNDNKLNINTIREGFTNLASELHFLKMEINVSNFEDKEGESIESKCILLRQKCLEYENLLFDLGQTYLNNLFSVKEAYPKENGSYLVLAPESFPKNSKFIVAEFYTDNNTFYSEYNDEPLEDVTYWTFLPEEV